MTRKTTTTPTSVNDDESSGFPLTSFIAAASRTSSITSGITIKVTSSNSEFPSNSMIATTGGKLGYLQLDYFLRANLKGIVKDMPYNKVFLVANM